MAHFSKLDENNVVIEVNVVNNEDVQNLDFPSSEQVGIDFLVNTLGLAGTWKQTSYNANFRKNYAGIGYIYHTILDAFIPPQPYPSWVLNESICRWEAPTPLPSDAGTGTPPKAYVWDEATTSWVELANV